MIRICSTLLCTLILLLSTAAAASLAQSETTKDKGAVASYSDERPANFVFLLDVSGSMVSARTQVKSADGSNVTLFEALRQALQQIVKDDRLLSPKSKVAFITFGTAITEKSDWPNSVTTSEERKALLSKIASATELQADKHGDTYMAGGLEAAYARAEQFAKDSPSCTSTFIVMLTDGWDEPPANASYKVADEAAKFIAKENELKQRLGVNTWQVRVVGLQRLPDKKAGTTTAAEVAKLLGGSFLDVSKEQTGTIAERIYAALKQTIAELQGEIELAAAGTPESIVDFGKIGDSPKAKGTFNAWNRSCYVEKLTGIKDCNNKLKASEIMQFRKAIEQLNASGSFAELPDHAKSLVLCSELPAGAIKVSLDATDYQLAPVERQGATAGQASGRVGLIATVGSSCPPGAYLGFMQPESSAKVKNTMAYLLTVPSRLTVDQESVKVQIRKPGFFLDKDTSTELAFKVGAKVNSSYSSDFEVTVLSSPATLKGSPKDKSKAQAQLPSKLIQNGEALNTTVRSADPNGTPVKLDVQIPASTEPGVYEGQITVKCKEHNDLVADTGVPFVIEILPSPWDEMAPIAIPVFAFLTLMILIGAYMALIGSRDRI